MLVPLDEWKSAQEKLRVLEILEGVKQGYNEALEMETAGEEGLPWDEFMDKLRKEVESDSDNL